MTAVATDEELKIIRETAAKIGGRFGDDAAGGWEGLRASGLTQLRTADGHGSPIGSAAVVVAVVDELARCVSWVPLVGHLLACELFRLAGVEPPTDEPLTVILDEDWRSLGTSVAWDAALARIGVSSAHGNVLCYELGAPVEGADATRPTRRTVGSGSPLGTLDADKVDAFESFARTVLAADLIGAAAGILDDALRYAGARKQFGAPIGSFQAVQHLCARSYVQLEAARSSLLFAVRALDSCDPVKVIRTSLVVKSWANDAMLETVEAAVQVFGGIAITTEHPAHRHLRRVLVDRATFGNAALLDDRLLDCVEA